jgi:hypothetical protein
VRALASGALDEVFLTGEWERPFVAIEASIGDGFGGVRGTQGKWCHR